MLNLSPLTALRMGCQGIYNQIINRPVVISYEATLSCNCNCRHCDHGGIKKNEKQLGPAVYGRITRHFNPVVVQISGGEPLLREDILEVVRAVKQAGAPLLIFVTNGALLNEEVYLQLHRAGVNQVSVSLDFPDERHDDFRRRRGLYRHLEQVIPQLGAYGHGDVILNSVITKANLKEILPLCQKARDWNVAISFSIYTPLRTGERGYCLDTDEDLALLRDTIGALIEQKKQTNHMITPATVLQDTLKFVEQGYNMPNCKSGMRFFVVTPEGDLIPCSLHRDKKYSIHKEMIEEFSRTNQCSSCYISLRSFCGRSLWELVRTAPAYGKMIFSRP
ncbi:radical SAM protein [Chloroflexota bacterium]